MFASWMSAKLDHSYWSQLVHLVGGEETITEAPNRFVMQWYQTDNKSTQEIPPECRSMPPSVSGSPTPFLATCYSRLFAAKYKCV